MEAKERFSSDYIEVYVKANLETVIQRDTKGLYKKALQGKLSNMIGLDSGVPYEEPIAPSIILDTNDDSIENEKLIDSQINIFDKNVQSSEVKSYSFEKPSLENTSNEQDDQKIIFGIEDDYNEIDEYEKMEVKSTNDKSLDYQEELIDDDTPEILYEKYKSEREERIKKYDSSNKIQSEIKESENKLIPAFKRKKINLIDENIDNISEKTETLEIESDTENLDED